MGLTSLFGMGRGGHHRYRHLNIFIDYQYLTTNDILLKEVKFRRANNVCFDESLGLLVLLDCGVATFTSVAYQRSSLLRPYMESSSRG